MLALGDASRRIRTSRDLSARRSALNALLRDARRSIAQAERGHLSICPMRRCAVADRADARSRRAAKSMRRSAAARRSGDDQGKRRPVKAARRSMASSAFAIVIAPPTARRSPISKRAGADHHRPHQHAGVQLSPRHGQRLSRSHLQPVVARRIRRAARRAVRRRRWRPASRRSRTATTSPARCAIPRTACGIAGMRPSFGRVPAYNPTRRAERVAVVRSSCRCRDRCARSVADVRVAARTRWPPRDPRDPWWVPAPLDGPAAAEADARRRGRPRPRTWRGSKLHPHVSRRDRKAAARWRCRRRLRNCRRAHAGLHARVTSCGSRC